VQVSVVPEQETHAPPPVPQVDAVLGLHAFPLQQPLAHEVASQAHAPPVHSCPLEHALATPHWHEPAAEHALASVVLHVTQALPLKPQFDVEGASHVEPLQQPLGQEAALQTQLPTEHTCPKPQAGLTPHMH